MARERCGKLEKSMFNHFILWLTVLIEWISVLRKIELSGTWIIYDEQFAATFTIYITHGLLSVGPIAQFVKRRASSFLGKFGFDQWKCVIDCAYFSCRSTEEMYRLLITNYEQKQTVTTWNAQTIHTF